MKFISSVRSRIFLVVAFIAMSPLLILIVSTPYEAMVERRLVQDLDSVSKSINGETTRLAVSEALSKNNVWGRFFEPSKPGFKFDGPSQSNLVGVFEDTRTILTDWDRRQPPLKQRAEASEQKIKRKANCVIGHGEQLLICSRVVRIVMDGQPRTLHLLTANVRNVRALSFVGVVQLSMEMFVLALFIGFWLVRRILMPVESLHKQVVGVGPANAKRVPINVDDDSEIGALSEEFERLLRRLETHNHQTEAFASDLAHELKNPLAAILSCADNLRAGLIEPEYIDKYVGVLDRSSEKLRSLVDDFLQLARAESGLRHAKRATLNIATVVFGICDQLEGDYNLESGYFELSLNSVEVCVSTIEFRSAVQNVIENAVQIGSPRMRISSQSIDGFVQIDIRDFGPGFGDVELEHVFERFFSRREGGTGLGLAISKAIIIAEGGSIEAVRTDAGSLFTIRLPAVTS